MTDPNISPEYYFCRMMKYAKKILILAGWLLCFLPTFVRAQYAIDNNDLILASRYYQDKEFGKAADIYLKIFETSQQSAYFNIFLNCLTEMRDYERAEKEIKKQLRGAIRRPELYVQYGYILKLQKRNEEADKNFHKAMDEVEPAKPQITMLANEFLTRAEFEYAEKTYLKGMEILPNEDFHYDLARVYMYQRNYEKMIDEYLIVLKNNEQNLTNVENSILSALSLDVDGSLNTLFRNKLLTQIQAEPERIVFNRLLIWFFTQEKRFTQALRQQIALDRRTGTEEEFILNLALIAGANQEYDEAIKAYDYLIAKGKQHPAWQPAMVSSMLLKYRQFTNLGQNDKAKAQTLFNQFESCLSEVGYTRDSYQLIIQQAHLQAFFLQQAKPALQLLEKATKITGLTLPIYSEIKTEIADIQVLVGDEWEAVLLYSQVIEDNKTNALGDEVKLKKARLSYYLGDLKWALAQLDVIKASTSKLTSNDAFELSILIGNNLSEDSTDRMMQRFAYADLLLYRNQDSLAMQLFDSLYQADPAQNLADDILFRKASIFRKKGQFEKAAEQLKIITEKYNYDLLADDALFMLASIFQFNLNEKEKAQELYKQMLTQHPGSVYATESRNRYRILRGDMSSSGETDFFEGKQ